MGRTDAAAAVALLAAAAALCVFPWETAPALPAATSPWLTLCAVLATRRLSILALAALPLLIVSILRGRWFCRVLCPMGWLQRLAEWRRPIRGKLLKKCPPAGQWIMAAGLGGALFGMPLFLGWDPLVLWTAFFSAWRPSAPYFHEWRLAAGLPLLLLLAWLFPRLWCVRLCPLGAWMDVCHRVAVFAGKQRDGLRCRTVTASSSKSNVGAGASEVLPQMSGISRRGFVGLAGGFLAAGALRGWSAQRGAKCLRPPGAVAEDRFNGRCARCGNCMRACPSGIIRPGLLEGGLAGALTPVIEFQDDYCHETCAACAQVCPTGAIRRFPLARKPDYKIGTARVIHDKCLAWKHGEYCMVCDEFCPYKAVRVVKHGGVNFPEVDEALCRGCGACQCQCPADPGPAIVVERDGAETERN